MEINILELMPEIGMIQNEGLRKTVARIWLEAIRDGGWVDPREIPFNPAMGPVPSLVDHTRSVTRTAMAYAEDYEGTYDKKIDRDLLAASAILHDVSKVFEFVKGRKGTEKSEVGKKLPHGTYSGFLAWREGLSTELLHLILTHSPAVEMLPQRVEGFILKYADLMDADAHYFSAGFPTLWERYRVF